MLDWTAVYVIWLREMKRFFRDRSQLLIGVVRPLTWFFFLGYGLSPAVRMGTSMDYRHFVLPGMMIMAILFTAIQSSIGIIWDREFGFLKEMLAAPISRTSIVVGKALGGTTLAVFEASFVLALAPWMGLSLTLGVAAEVLAFMFLIAFGLSTLGITIASRMKSFEGFGAVMNFLVMPLFLLSGALFPIGGQPWWLRSLMKINPLSYGVALIRGALLAEFTGMPWKNLIIVAGFALLMTVLAVYQFHQQEV